MCCTGVLIGVIGYYSFQNTTDEQIFKNLKNLHIVGMITKIFYSLSLLASIVLYGYSILSFIDKGIKANRTATRAVFILVVFYISTQITEITIIYGLYGCFITVCLGFFYPIVISEKYFKNDLKNQVLNYFVLVVGIIGGVLGVCSIVFQMGRWKFI